MANTIKIKNSGTASNAPSAASLQYGELALNYVDGKLYFKNTASTVNSFLAGISNFDSLTDVVITTPTSGQIISYDGTNWVNIDNYSTATKNYVKNDSGGTLAKGAVVYTSGANGDNILVKGAIANSDATSASVMGLLETSLASNGIGFVVTNGLVSGIDTSAATAGDPVWLSPSSAGGVVYGLANKPSAPNHLVYLGTVTRSHATNGQIFVHILNGWELEELHNVSISSPQSGDFLKYNGSLWVNDPIDLGTDTTGNYVGTITAGTGISTSGASTGEGIAHTISLSSGVATPGTYKSVTVDTYGRVTSGSNPTTLAGYGITDAQKIIAVSDSAPSSPAIGDLWYKTDIGAMLIYYDSSWVEIAVASYGVLDGGTP